MLPFPAGGAMAAPRPLSPAPPKDDHFSGAMDDVFHPYEGERREWEGPEARIEADEATAAPITDEEAEWLMKRLGSGRLSAAGHALAERLKAQVPDANARLKPLIDAA